MAADTSSPTSGREARPEQAWRRLSEIGEWAKRTQGNCRRFSLHIELTTKGVEQRLRKAAGGRLRDRATASWKARKAVRQWYRAAAHLDAAADCMAKGWQAGVLKEFDELIHPQANKESFDWQH